MTGLEHHSWVWIIAFAAIVALALYLRGRRLVGRQRVRNRRIRIRVVIFVVLAVLIAFSYARYPDPALIYAGAVAGLVVGALLAAVSIRLTRMGRDDKGLWYTPNLYLGIGLIALLIARYVYEYVVIFPKVRQAAASNAAISMGGASTAILHGILFLVLGYYLVYYAGILLRARKLESRPAADASSEEDTDST